MFILTPSPHINISSSNCRRYHGILELIKACLSSSFGSNNYQLGNLWQVT